MSDAFGPRGAGENPVPNRPQNPWIQRAITVLFGLLAMGALAVTIVFSLRASDQLFESV